MRQRLRSLTRSEAVDRVHEIRADGGTAYVRYLGHRRYVVETVSLPRVCISRGFRG